MVAGEVEEIESIADPELGSDPRARSILSIFLLQVVGVLGSPFGARSAHIILLGSVVFLCRLEHSPHGISDQSDPDHCDPSDFCHRLNLFLVVDGGTPVRTSFFLILPL